MGHFLQGKHRGMSPDRNRHNSQIPECTCSISHNAPFRTEMCTFLFWMEHCGIWNRCILGLVKLVYCWDRYILFVFWNIANQHDEDGKSDQSNKLKAETNIETSTSGNKILLLNSQISVFVLNINSFAVFLLLNCLLEQWKIIALDDIWIKNTMSWRTCPNSEIAPTYCGNQNKSIYASWRQVVLSQSSQEASKTTAGYKFGIAGQTDGQPPKISFARLHAITLTWAARMDALC